MGTSRFKDVDKGIDFPEYFGDIIDAPKNIKKYISKGHYQVAEVETTIAVNAEKYGMTHFNFIGYEMKNATVKLAEGYALLSEMKRFKDENPELFE